jgi:O-antigen/teichoic acid export membrane protein
MRKTFVSNLILLVGLNLLVKPVYLLVVEATIQDRVGAAEFGNYFALISFSFLLNIILDLGLTNWNTRHVAQNPEAVAHRFHLIFTMRMALALLYLLLCFVLGITFGYTSSQLSMVGVLAFNQFLVAGIQYLRSNLAGMHLFKQDSILSILDRLILTLHMSYLLWFSGNEVFQTEWLVYGQTLAYGITFCIAFLLVKKHSGVFRFEWQLSEVRALLADALPYAALIFVTAIAYRIDSVLLERMRGPEEAGHYAMGFRFFEATNMVSYLFATLLLPIFSRMLHRNEAVAPLVSLSYRLMLVGTTMVASASWFWAEDILSLIYSVPHASAIGAFRWLMIGCAAFSLQYIFGTLITASGQMKLLVRIALAGVVGSILLNVLLIPEYGAEGAAIANAAVQCTVLVAQMLAVATQMKVKLGSDLGRTALFLPFVIFLAWLFSTQITINNTSFAYCVALFVASTLASALALGMLNAKRFLAIIRSDK